MNKEKTNKAKKCWTILWVAVAAVIIYIVCANAFILGSTGASMVSEQDAKSAGAQCVMVLGAQIIGDSPSPILKNRLDCGIRLYQQGAVPKIILTGNGGREEDEVSVMFKYTLDAGVPAQDIFLDREGFDTYASMYRAKEVFGVNRILVVTQAYHLSRSIYIARAMGMETVGVAAQPEARLQILRDVREIAARCKDLATSLFKPSISIAGSLVSVSGDGRVTQ